MLKLLTRLRNYLISGLLFWIPLILTIIVIKFFLEFINSLVPQEYLPESVRGLKIWQPNNNGWEKIKYEELLKKKEN